MEEEEKKTERGADLGKPKPGVGLARVLGVGSRLRAADGGGTAAGGCRRGDGGAGALLVRHSGGLRREDRAVRPRAPGPSPLLFCSRHRCFLSALASSGSSARERRGKLGCGRWEVLPGKFLLDSTLGFSGEDQARGMFAVSIAGSFGEEVGCCHVVEACEGDLSFRGGGLDCLMIRLFERKE